ncbi:MAG: hypothetical protein M3157_05095, partial [Actinomycetota bacterium]|nr:hypothetical protein [Actinomycetota bacterium]
LRQRLEDVPALVSRDEVREMGIGIGLEDPADAIRIFDRLKGVSWRGDYITNGDGWIAARVTEVN